MRGLSFVFVVVTSLLLPGCEKYALDKQMEELCAKDGGIKVYEKVVLPGEMFDKNGNPFPGWWKRPESERLGNEYLFTYDTTYLKEGEPMEGNGRLSRHHWRVIRKSDNKLLGEGISYGRSGGDFLVLGHPSSKSCPLQFGESEAVIRAIFSQQ